MSSMFCYQCEQTSQGTGCTAHGVCGKDPETAALQDLLVHAATGIAQYAHRARQLGAKDRSVDLFVIESLFTTVTNVNFDRERFFTEIERAFKMRERIKARVLEASGNGEAFNDMHDSAKWQGEGEESLLKKAAAVGCAS